jgi:hypothetical protein
MKTLFLAGLTAITMLSCTNKAIDADYNPQLPPETQIGARTFGCKINGIITIPQNGKIQGIPGGGLIKGLELWDNLESISIEAIDAQYNRGDILIKIPNTIINAGEYKIEPIMVGFETTNANILYMQAFKNGKFYGAIENTGKINFVKKDDIWAGTFYCKLSNKDDPNDIIDVTEGRFDIKVKLNK